MIIEMSHVLSRDSNKNLLRVNIKYIFSIFLNRKEGIQVVYLLGSMVSGVCANKFVCPI